MKDKESHERQLRVLAIEALEYYEGIMWELKRELVMLMKRYAFVSSGGQGLKFPRAVKVKQEGEDQELMHSKAFKRIVVYLVSRESPAHHRILIKRLSSSLHIPKSQIHSWVRDSSLPNLSSP